MNTFVGSVSSVGPSDVEVSERLREAEMVEAMAVRVDGAGSPTTMAFLMSEPLRPTMETPIMTVTRESHW